MRRLRVAFFSDTYLHNPNGISTSLDALARSLRRMGHEVWIVAPSRPKHEPEDFHVIRVPSIAYPFYADLRVAIPTALNHLPTLDIIHCHTPFSLGRAGARLAKARSIPLVSSVHIDYHGFTDFVPLLGSVQKRVDIVSALMRWAYNDSTLVLSPTQYVRTLLNRAGVSAPKMLMPSGVDIASLRSSETVTSPWPKGSHKLLYVGRLSTEKKCEVAIRALSMVPDAHLVIIGDGPSRNYAHRFTTTLGVEERVTFLGEVDYCKMGGYFRLADILISTCTNETQGMAVWEAQAMGVPVIAADSGGTKEAILHRRTGMLAHSDSPHSFARQIEWLMQDSNFRSECSAMARQWASSRDIIRISAELSGVYLQLVSARSDLPLPYPSDEALGPSELTVQKG